MTTLMQSTGSQVCDPPGFHPELPARYQPAAAGSEAEEELVRAHLPLVKTVVGRLAMTLPAHVDAEDLFSAGLVGLLNAARNFNPRGGSSFVSYARVRIRGAIIDELRRLDWVPRSVHDKARKVEAAIRELEQAKGKIAEPREIATALRLSLPEYEQLLEEIKPAAFVSLDAPAEEDDDAGRYESIADPSQRDPSEAAAVHELSGMILERMQTLPEIQRKVLALYYFEGLRLREIAEVFGVTESRVCQVHAQAILTLKAAVRRIGETEGEAAS